MPNMTHGNPGTLLLQHATAGRVREPLCSGQIRTYHQAHAMHPRQRLSASLPCKYICCKFCSGPRMPTTITAARLKSSAMFLWYSCAPNIIINDDGHCSAAHRPRVTAPEALSLPIVPLQNSINKQQVCPAHPAGIVSQEAGCLSCRCPLLHISIAEGSEASANQPGVAGRDVL